MKNGTWSLESLPAERKAIGCRWVLFKVKPGHVETPTIQVTIRRKRVFSNQSYLFQRNICPCCRLLFPTLGSVHLRSPQLRHGKLYIKTAFLYGQVEEKIFIEQPEGFIVVGKEHLVGRLNKCIYGLKQSLNVWNTKFNGFLIKFGFIRSKHDPCVYFRRREEEILILIIWDNDGLICSNNR